MLDDRSMRRLRGTARVRQRPTVPGHGKPVHPVFLLTANLSSVAEIGTMDRPDRSAWVTAGNRVQVSKIVDEVDRRLGVKRSGSHVGRIYVDGLIVEATPEQVAGIDGVSVRNHGPAVRIFRAGSVSGTCYDGKPFVEGAGLVAHGSTELDLVEALRNAPDLDAGPFAAGRIWTQECDGEDPRMEPGRWSEPMCVDLSLMKSLGFGQL